MTSTDARSKAAPPLTLHAALKRALFTATVPGSPAAPLVADAVAAADIAERVAQSFIASTVRGAATELFAEAISPAVDEVVRERLAAIEAKVRADERERCGAKLRTHAARLRAVATSLNGHVTAEATERAADLIDPQGPVMGAPAAGGIS